MSKSDTNRELHGIYADLHDKYCGFLRNNTKETTYETRKSCLRQWMRYCQEEDIDVRTAEEDDLRLFIDRNLHKADTMIASLVSTISVFSVWACNRNHCESNPAEQFSLADDPDYNIDPQTSQKVKVLLEKGKTDDPVISISPSEVQKLFEHPGSPAIRNELTMRLLYQTGLRAVNYQMLSYLILILASERLELFP